MIATVQERSESKGGVVEVLSRTGLRWGELCGLQANSIVKDLYLALMVRESESDGLDAADPKSGKIRGLALNDTAAEILLARTAAKPSTDRLFAN